MHSFDANFVTATYSEIAVRDKIADETRSAQLSESEVVPRKQSNERYKNSAMRKFNPLCFVLRVSRFVGVFPVAFSDKKFIIQKRFQLWSAFILSIYYVIELTKFIGEVEVFGSMGSYSFLTLVMITFSNINTLLNFVYVFFIIKRLLPLLNILHDIFVKLLNGKFELYVLVEISVMTITFSSLSNLFYLLFYSFTSASNVTAMIRIALYIIKSMSYTCIAWHFCSACNLISLLMEKINSQIEAMENTPCNLDELRHFYSTLCEICHMLDDFFGRFTLFYLILANMHLQIDLFIVLKNAYNLAVGAEADVWGPWGLFNRLVWVFLSAMKVFSFIWAVTRLTSQVICRRPSKGVQESAVRYFTFCCSAIKRAHCWLKSATQSTAIHYRSKLV